ncbi:AT-hook-containing transcription factor [Elysia marginata]|uniref:AT-hook-containing transcription factor n=1 Tax=Elysia marginata TaxID=1093978 RepID=A0AAV4JLE0_9GAST|nr:AT-hook-containing transcription factor [Elysia marginata]
MIELLAGNIGFRNPGHRGESHLLTYKQDGAATDTVDGRPPAIPGDQRSRSRGVAIGTGTADSNFLGSSTSSLRMSGSSVTPAESEDGLREFPEQAATVKVELMTQARALDERLETFWNSLSQGQLTLEQQEQMLDQIKGDHDKLRRTYLQAKDDYNVLRRSGVVDKDTINFDENKELEGQLFRLGMRFDEVHETVESNLKERPAQRQPFQTDNNVNNRPEANRTDGATPVNTTTDSAIKGRPLSRTSSLDPTEEAKFERRVDNLRQEYNDSMDAYRKLKYSADSTPEGEREIESVVKRLNEICTEMPDMFRLSPEIQARWEKLNRREQEAKTQRQSPVPPSPRTRGSRQSPVDGRPPSILRQTSDASDVDSIRARLDGSRSSLGSILPDRMDRPPSRGHGPGSHQDRPSSRASNRSSRGGGTARFDPDRPPSSSTNGRQSPTPSLPRPRRHAHELKDPKLSKMPDMSLPRNSGGGGSDGENRRRRSASPSAGAVGGAEGALAALPGPGKFKQMTKQRGADDADSGFLGSMVGSGVGVPPLLPAASQQSLDQQAEDERDRERTLRLRQRADDSSTVTDNSIDMSTQAMRPPSGRRRENSQNAARQEGGRSRGGHQLRAEESYDGEEDTMDALDSESGRNRPRGGQARRRSHRDSSRDISLDATLEEDDSMESDPSTPRAPREGPTPPPLAKKRNSGQQASASQEAQTPVKPRRPGSRTQTASETEEELRAINNSKIRSGQRQQQEKESKRAARPEEKETIHRTRLKSPPPPLRPSSRGSPTTDLYRTRGRHSSGDSRRSGTGSRRGGHRETTREERQEDGQMREEIRQTQQGPHIDRPSSRQGRQRQQQQQQQSQQQQQQREQEQQNSTGLPPGLAPASDLARRVKDYEERSVGSSDVEIGSSVTRASSVNSSNRLKALQEEIEKLKEGVARANEKASRPPPQYPQAPPNFVHNQSQQAGPSSAPPPAAAPANQSPDQHQDFYDPFDDPYGFMRMPRRRANSFSGGRERDWGEWYWNLPQNRPYDGGDIPLGYAAADAYAENAPQRRDGRERNTRENVKERMRQRRQERKQKEEGQAEAPASSPLAGPPVHDLQTQALYDYYVPPSRYSARGMRSQLASRGYFTTPTGAKIYSSTGEDGDIEGEGQDEENSGERDWTQHWFGFQQGPETQQRPWYQIRRASRPLSSLHGGFGPQFHPGSRLTQSQEDTASATCPMCGSSGSHTHANYTHVGRPVATSYPQPHVSLTTPTYARTTSPVRGRSRSVGRSHSHSRYKVREYTSFSDSDEEKSRPRSRSMSRGRTRPKSRSRQRSSRRYSSDSLSDRSGDERVTGLDRSLSLSQDISRLTKKMLGNLKGELRRSKGKQREFGSSYW